MSDTIRVGIIGTDTSHVVAFTELLHDTGHPFHVVGGRVTAAFAGGSPDFELSISRVHQFAEQLASHFGVKIVDSPEEVASDCDAILLESADGRVHMEQFARIAAYGKPVFIDKPLALSVSEAREISAIAERAGIPLMSASALRFSAALAQTLEASTDLGKVTGADCFGPMSFEPTQSGYFWYGIHTAEILYALMGTGCLDVTVTAASEHDILTGRWSDGRIGVIRGNRSGNYRFGAMIHREKGSAFADIAARPEPFYASLLKQVIRFFQDKKAPLAMTESIEVIRFLEAANESRSTGQTVRL